MTQPNTFYNNLLVRYFSPSDVPLVISELALAFLKDRDKMNKIVEEGNIRGYFARSIYFWATKSNLKQILSGETTISKWAEQVDGLEISDHSISLFEDIEDKLLNCNVSFRDATMFRLVFRDGLTYRDIQIEYGWSPSTVCRSIQASVKKIKDQIG
jgi:DNA-directed RNA polymerase specialized sigma subunit